MAFGVEPGNSARADRRFAGICLSYGVKRTAVWLGHIREAYKFSLVVLVFIYKYWIACSLAMILSNFLEKYWYHYTLLLQYLQLYLIEYYLTLLYYLLSWPVTLSYPENDKSQLPRISG